jgi:hypothetical protein
MTDVPRPSKQKRGANRVGSADMTNPTGDVPGVGRAFELEVHGIGLADRAEWDDLYAELDEIEGVDAYVLLQESIDATPAVIYLTIEGAKVILALDTLWKWHQAMSKQPTFDLLIRTKKGAEVRLKASDMREARRLIDCLNGRSMTDQREATLTVSRRNPALGHWLRANGELLGQSFGLLVRRERRLPCGLITPAAPSPSTG